MAPLYDVIVINGRVVSASDVASYAIGIKDGKIAALQETFTDTQMRGAEIIDAEGAYVMPGGIDCHVHLCQDLQSGPHGLGGRCADDFSTGSLSALCGGTTTMINFATQTRSESDRSLLSVLERYRERAEVTGSHIDYAFHVIIVRDDEDILRDELPKIVNEWGVTSCKLFLTYETMRLRDGELLDVMLAAKKVGMTTMIHAENGDMIEWLTEKLEDKGMIEPYYHAVSRPPLVEGEATNRAIALAELIDNPILFVHIGSVMAMENIRHAQTRGLPIFAETCPQYLELTWEDLKRFHSPTCFENSKMICSPPPPPDDSDRDALYLGIHNGTFTIFSSDHCPFRYDDPNGKPAGIIESSPRHHHLALECKDVRALTEQEKGKFRFIPNGIPGVETRLPLLYTGGVMTGRITPSKFVEVTSTNPAKLYGLYPKKGALLPGSDADIVIWHPDQTFEPFVLNNARLHHNVDYTPYEGMTFSNWPRYTLLRGQVLYGNGKVHGGPLTGEFVRRGPNQLGICNRKKDVRRTATWLDS